MKIYTRKGDSGETGLFGGTRLRKDAARIEAYGTIDELNAVLGLARTEAIPGFIDQVLGRIQNELFDLGAELATPDPKARGTNTIGDAHVATLESDIDQAEANLAPLANFILPGGTPGASYLHLSRTVCRRAERRLVTLVVDGSEPISSALITYVNRLSDLLFVLGRAANAAAGVSDVHWEKSSTPRGKSGEG